MDFAQVSDVLVQYRNIGLLGCGSIPTLVPFLCVSTELQVDVQNHQCSDESMLDRTVLHKGRTSYHDLNIHHLFNNYFWLQTLSLQSSACQELCYRNWTCTSILVKAYIFIQCRCLVQELALSDHLFSHPNTEHFGHQFPSLSL